MVSKCIGAMDNVRLFSEIHPAANNVAYMNVTDQAHRWYQLASKEDVDKGYGFIQGVKRIHLACEAAGLQMVLRDWASVDFVGRLLVGSPSRRFELDHALRPHFRLHTIALVRHPLDQWLSTRRLKIYRGKLDSNAFFEGYRHYAENVAGKFVRYEDFTADPTEVMRQICHALELDYDHGFLDRWRQNDCITGDNKNSSRGSSGAGAGEIRPMPRREVESALLREVESNADYQASLRLLGYRSALP